MKSFVTYNQFDCKEVKMEITEKIIPITSIKIDEEIYPRVSVDWVTSARYYNALKSGAVFPPIVVAVLEKKFILVDGGHRLKAHKDNKETHLKCEVLKGLTRAEIYEEAVRRNSTHGRQFSTQEVTKIIVTLENFGYDSAKISELVRIPANELKSFVAKRMTRITETNEEIYLKSPLKHLSGIIQDEMPKQDLFNSKSQIHLLSCVIDLLENKYVNRTDELVMEKLAKIYKLLPDYLILEEVAK